MDVEVALLVFILYFDFFFVSIPCQILGRKLWWEIKKGRWIDNNDCSRSSKPHSEIRDTVENLYSSKTLKYSDFCGG